MSGTLPGWTTGVSRASTYVDYLDGSGGETRFAPFTVAADGGFALELPVPAVKLLQEVRSTSLCHGAPGPTLRPRGSKHLAVNGFTAVTPEQSFRRVLLASSASANLEPKAGDVFVWHLYAASAFTLTGSCRSATGDVAWELLATRGWNYLVVHVRETSPTYRATVWATTRLPRGVTWQLQ